jgi:hypothetical protein
MLGAHGRGHDEVRLAMRHTRWPGPCPVPESLASRCQNVSIKRSHDHATYGSMRAGRATIAPWPSRRASAKSGAGPPCLSCSSSSASSCLGLPGRVTKPDSTGASPTSLCEASFCPSSLSASSGGPALGSLERRIGERVWLWLPSS